MPKALNAWLFYKVFSPGILVVVAMPVALFSIQHFSPGKLNSYRNNTYKIAFYRLNNYRFHLDTCSGVSSSNWRFSDGFKSYNGDKSIDVYDYKVCNLITRVVNYLSATRLKIKFTPTWSCSFSPFNFSARQRILSCNQNNIQKMLLSAGFWASHAVCWSQTEDHIVKNLILINCKQQGNNSTCCSMMSLLITMISLNMLACSSNVAWSTTIKPLIDNWVFLKIHYSEEHLLRQRCLNQNYQTFWKTTEWYWMIFRCVGISL